MIFETLLFKQVFIGHFSETRVECHDFAEANGTTKDDFSVFLACQCPFIKEHLSFQFADVLKISRHLLNHSRSICWRDIHRFRVIELFDFVGCVTLRTNILSRLFSFGFRTFVRENSARGTNERDHSIERTNRTGKLVCSILNRPSVAKRGEILLANLFETDF